MTLIELHGAHGYLLSAFLSPLANRRTDRFGGSLENRMRLPLMVADAVRAALPEGVTMGMRINGTDHAEGGITPDEAGTLAVALREAGLDYVCVSAGGNSRHQQIPPTVPGYQVGLAEEVRRRSGLPTMAVGMILTGRQAEDILAEGRADMVAIGRAALDDPRWPRHALQSLGARPDYPRPYWRSGPDIWRGYAAVHPEAGPG